MYKHQDFDYTPQHPNLKNYNNCPACLHQDDRFQHSAACGFLDRKECKQADAIWAKIMAKGEEDRADFVKMVKKRMQKTGFIPEGPRLIESIRKAQQGVWKEYADLLEELEKKYHLITVDGKGLYQWFGPQDKKKAMWDYFGWLKNVINWSIDPKGKYAGQRGPVPTLKDIASANTVGSV